jgi:HAD-superfamily hydrolase, subfamily IA, variant 1 family protein
MADLTDTNGKKIDFSSNYTVGMIFRSNEVTGNIKNSFGFDHSTFAANSVVKVKAKSDGSPVLEVDSADIGKVNKIYEQYYLAHTAYAIVPVNPKDGRSDTTPDDGRFDIYLHYNYRPWLGEKYNDTNTPKALLASGVKGFSYKALDNTIILQLCMTDIRLPINEASLEENIVCKRRAVL